MKKILLFGSSGSIGKSALDIVRHDPKNFKVLGLSVHKDVATLKKQVREFTPRYVCVVDETQAKRIKSALGRNVALMTGERGLLEFADITSDISVMGIVGMPCLRPLLRNIKRAKRIALASKEALVVAGPLVISEAKKYNTELMPVDSEINALSQLFSFIDKKALRKVYLTASGGPLVDYTKNELKRVTRKQVLAHPTWRMGKRITVDSATLVNKGFEVMESHYLFGLSYDAIDIVVHRQSYIHALIEAKDNTVFACLYAPSMKIPIAYALYYPKRSLPIKGFSFPFSGSRFSFDAVRRNDFPLLGLVLDAARRAANYPIIVNAADEICVEYFLHNKIRFHDMHRCISHIFKKTKRASVRSIADIIYWDAWARRKSKEYLKARM